MQILLLALAFRCAAASVKVASVAITPIKWDKAANWIEIERRVEEAAEAGAELVCTPEGVLEGYVMNEVNKMLQSDGACCCCATIRRSR